MALTPEGLPDRVRNLGSLSPEESLEQRQAIAALLFRSPKLGQRRLCLERQSKNHN